MAKKETLQDFVKNLGKYPALVEREALNMWNQETLATMGKAIFYAPKDKGTLQISVREVRAKLTPNGIKSAFVFAVPYAFDLERGKRKDGTEINIKTIVNPNAQSGYSARAVDEQEPFFISGLKKVIGIAFNRI